MRKTRLLLLLLVAACLLSGGLTALTPREVAAADPVRYDRFDVDIQIDASGNFRVTERQVIAFPVGTFTRASRNIGLDSVVDIRDVAISEGDRSYSLAQTSASRTPNTFSTERSASNLKIEWYFSQATGQRRTFAIAYTVVGGLRINADVDVLDWTALRPDLSADAVTSAVTVQLPRAVDAASLKADSRGAPATVRVVDGRTVRFDAGAVNRGKGLEVKVSFPHGLVSATAAPWQTRFEQQQAIQQRSTAVQNFVTLASFVFGLLILIGGGLGLYLLWYLRGRDRYTGLVAEYLREPPSDISPGVVGTLLDERADLHDVLATFEDLGRKGALHIDEVQTPGVMGFGGGRDFVIEQRESGAALSAFERTLVGTIFMNGTGQTRMSTVKAQLTAAMPRFGQELYAEVVALGYFTQSPEATRQRYRRLGLLLLGVAFFGWLALIFTVGSAAGGLTLAAIPLGIIGLALVGLARAMPAKTALGAEEAAKWQAFKRYLANLEQYDNLAEARGIFERYLPYATAFGLEQGFIRKFASVDTPAPSWYGGGGGYGGGGYGGPIIIGGPGGYYGGSGGGYTGGAGGPGGGAPSGDSGGGGQIPTLQQMSDSGGGGLQGWSDNLSGMLSSAGSLFGGGGGGGSDSGWSGGGGGGGDSGGGGDFG